MKKYEDDIPLNNNPTVEKLLDFIKSILNKYFPNKKHIITSHFYRRSNKILMVECNGHFLTSIDLKSFSKKYKNDKSYYTLRMETTFFILKGYENLGKECFLGSSLDKTLKKLSLAYNEFADLKTEKTKSDQSKKGSSGERKIAEYLKNKNIKFDKEYTYYDLLGNNGGKLRFDFALIKKHKVVCLLEFQGPQHYEYLSWMMTKEKYRELREHDYRKKEYCTLYGIPLEYIKYDENIKSKLQLILEKHRLV